ncbi:MAG: chemotaxis protein CheW, partial [Limnobacter sp.]|nr:chemotaxis protein CheW [Limnobacter sp.]
MYESSRQHSQGYGCFRFAGLNLAIEIAALREVVPFEGLVDLPCQARFIEGAVLLRGILVPVLNLGKLLDKPFTSADHQCVVIVRHEGKVLGLLTTEIQGLHFLSRDRISPIFKQPESSGLLQATLTPTAALTSSALDVPALFKLQGIVAARDQDISFKGQADGDPIHAVSKSSQRLLLIKAGNRDLAFSPNDIEATLPNPVIEKPDYATALFLGTFDYRGAKVPAVQLSELMGFKPSQVQGTQIVVIKVNTGPIGLVINQVVELIEAPEDQFCPVPQLGFAKPQWLQSILPNQSLPASVMTKLQPQGGYHLVLNIAAIQHAQELCALAKTYQTSALEAKSSLKGASFNQNGPDNRVVIFQTDRELCVSVKVVSEILKYDPSIQSNQADPEILGVMTDRGRSIPVFDTGYLIDQTPSVLDVKSAILL